MRVPHYGVAFLGDVVFGIYRRVAGPAAPLADSGKCYFIGNNGSIFLLYVFEGVVGWIHYQLVCAPAGVRPACRGAVYACRVVL